MSLLSLPSEMLLYVVREATSGKPIADEGERLITKRALVLVSHRMKDIAYPLLHEAVNIRTDEEVKKFLLVLRSRAENQDGGFGQYVKRLSISSVVEKPNAKVFRDVACILKLCRGVEYLDVGIPTINSAETLYEWDEETLKAAHLVWRAIPDVVRFLELSETRLVPGLSEAETSDFIASHSQLTTLHIGCMNIHKHLPPSLFKHVRHLNIRYIDSTVDLELPNMKSLYVEEIHYDFAHQRLIRLQPESLTSVVISRAQDLYYEQVRSIFENFPNMEEFSYKVAAEGTSDLNTWGTDPVIGLRPSHSHHRLRVLHCVCGELCVGPKDSSEEVIKVIDSVCIQLPGAIQLIRKNFPGMERIRVIMDNMPSETVLCQFREVYRKGVPEHIALEVVSEDGCLRGQQLWERSYQI